MSLNLKTPPKRYETLFTDGMLRRAFSEACAIGNTEASEHERMQIVGHVIPEHADQKYFNDVLKRKMTFVTGRGKVHGDLYDITCLGIG